MTLRLAFLLSLAAAPAFAARKSSAGGDALPERALLLRLRLEAFAAPSAAQTRARVERFLRELGIPVAAYDDDAARSAVELAFPEPEPAPSREVLARGFDRFALRRRLAAHPAVREVCVESRGNWEVYFERPVYLGEIAGAFPALRVPLREAFASRPSTPWIWVHADAKALRDPEGLVGALIARHPDRIAGAYLVRDR